MNSITKERIELFIKNPLENGLTRGEQMELARIALASLEAEPLVPVMYKGMKLLTKEGLELIRDGIAEATGLEAMCMAKALLSVPSVPVVPDNVSGSLAYAYKELTPEIMRGHIAVFERYGIAPNDSSTTIHALRIALDGIERSAAMLHSAEPVSQTYNLPQTHFEQVADLYEMQFEDGRTCAFHTDAKKAAQWLQSCDGNRVQEYVKLERLQNALSGNYPVTPDGWISCSERMPDDGQHVIILCDGAFVLYAQYRDGEFFDIVRNGDEFFETQSRNVTDWMQLPEPPL